MSSTKQIADRYISRGGGSPFPTIDEYAADLLTVSHFILWHAENDMHGGVKMRAAYAAFCRIANVEQHVIEKIVRPQESLNESRV